MTPGVNSADSSMFLGEDICICAKPDKLSLIGRSIGEVALDNIRQRTIQLNKGFNGNNLISE